jgi:hypothetical protein
VIAFLAGTFLAVFGACGAWFLTTRFPSARFMLTGYRLMSLGGMLFMVWVLSKNVALGVAAMAALGTGAVIGVIGAVRRELRER